MEFLTPFSFWTDSPLSADPAKHLASTSFDSVVLATFFVILVNCYGALLVLGAWPQLPSSAAGDGKERLWAI